ncbi:MAG: hypothetical protein GY925_23005, partial [Actinomycetia bacterium]|nr:hypothetical protein [Actinomycetes bacterium]
MTIGDDLDRTLDGLATRIDEADATLSMIREDAGVDWARLEQRISAIGDRVTSLEAGDPDVPIIPPVTAPPPVVAPSDGGTVNVTGPSWTRYFRQARDLTGSDAGWGKLLFGQLGKDQALTARDTDDGIYTFGEAIDSLDAATKTPDPPFSMSANPSPK